MWRYIAVLSCDACIVYAAFVHTYSTLDRGVVQELKEKDLVYPCFCTDDELAAMKKAAEAADLPPVYNGKWARATAEQVQAEMDAGTPPCYRCAPLLLEYIKARKKIKWARKANKHMRQTVHTCNRCSSV